MVNGEQDGPGFPTSALITALILVAGAFAVKQAPYEASRPPLTEMARRPFVAVQDVEARLWQDPFAAVTQHIEQAPTRRPDGTRIDLDSVAYQHSSALLIGETLASGLPDTVVMPVMIPGGPYGEDIEGRRRTRHAVITALSRLGFTPDDPEHLGYFRPWPMIYEAELPKVVPWEQFSGSNPDSNVKRVLVLWLDSSAFRRAMRRGPFVTLERLLEALALCPTGESLWPSIAVIGPADSDGLDAMVEEVRGVSNAERTATGCLGSAAIYSPWATATFPDGPAGAARVIRTRLHGEGLPGPEVRFFPLIGPDASLMPALRRELELRHVDPARGDNAVAVVSELDTGYGRNLLETVKKGLCANARSDSICRSRVYSFEYMRGLDGEIGAGAGAKSSSPQPGSDERKSADPSSAKAKRVEEMERAEGDSQFDALRRLAALIRREHDRLVSKGLPGFASIGVFGNDFYDKLLVLQAIRRQFPGVVFFTTDLDARFLHPREFQWTRNLIVASSYGLELHPDVQAGVAPFRNNYEAATFLAVQVAIINAAPRDGRQIARETITNWTKSARIFEIGRTEAIDLTPQPPVPLSPSCLTLVDCPSVHPAPQSDRRAQPGGWVTVGLLGVALSLLVSSNVRRGLTATVRWWAHPVERAILVTLAVAVVVAAVTVAVRWEGADGEPFRIFEGVSIWPSEIVRGLALLVGVVGIVMTNIRRRRTERALDRYFGGSAEPSGPTVRELIDEACGALRRVGAVIGLTSRAPSAMGAGARSAWGRIFAGKPGRAEFHAMTYVDAETVWKEHRYQNAPLARWTRALISAAVFFAFASMLIFTLGTPHVPARGKVALIIDKVVIMSAVAAFILLIFTIGDAIKLCDKFAYYLGSPTPNRWPWQTRRHFGVLTADPQSALDAWIDIRFIAEWTGRIGSIIYYPFVVLLLLIVARSSIFDDWDIPAGLIAVFVMSFSLAAASVFILRHAAERLRRVSIERLTMALVTSEGADAPSARQLRSVLEEVRGLKQGAFAPVMHQPLVRAALLPLSGAGGIALIEYFFLRG